MNESLKPHRLIVYSVVVGALLMIVAYAVELAPRTARINGIGWLLVPILQFAYTNRTPLFVLGFMLATIAIIAYVTVRLYKPRQRG